MAAFLKLNNVVMPKETFWATFSLVDYHLIEMSNSK